VRRALAAASRDIAGDRLLLAFTLICGTIVLYLADPTLFG